MLRILDLYDMRKEGQKIPSIGDAVIDAHRRSSKDGDSLCKWIN